MSMQVSCVPQVPLIPPPSDMEIMKKELENIDRLMQMVTSGKATDDTYDGLKTAILATNEIIMSLDNSNDFFKIGGFNRLIPLLSCSDFEIVAATLELVADLCQNNTYCQTKILDFNILPELVKLLDSADIKVCSKALYALSCLCRHNKDAHRHLEVSGIVPLLLKTLLKPNQRLRTKTAFFLSYLTAFENFRETFYQSNIVKILIELLKEEQDSSSEHLLNALLIQVSKHKQSRIQCRQAELGLKDLLFEKMKFYESKDEYQEAKEYCCRILDTCFHE